MQKLTIMVVACQYRKAGASRKIPKTQRLIITGRQNPWKLRGIWMELNGPNVIQVTEKGEETSPQLVVPNL
jgi:hypothetical protein